MEKVATRKTSIWNNGSPRMFSLQYLCIAVMQP